MGVQLKAAAGFDSLREGTPQPGPARVDPGKRFVLLFGGWCLAVALELFLGVRFVEWHFDRLVQLLLLIAPWPLTLISARLSSKVLRWVTTIALAMLGLLLALPALFLSAVTLFSIHRAADPMREPIRRQPLGSTTLVLYRTDCGALCDWGLQLRQERTLLPGITMGRRLASWKREYSAALIPEPPGAIRVVFDPYPRETGKAWETTVEIRPSPLWPR